MVKTILRHTQTDVNNAGGETHRVDMWNRLNRFLILGTTGGTYYVSERELTLNNLSVVDACLNEDPHRALTMMTDVSREGRAPKNDYAIYALARACAHPVAKTLAYQYIPFVCRTGTHILQFVAAVDTMRGWGPALRKAVNNWYLTKDADGLAYQMLKYQNREGWSHRDVFRKTHPVTKDGQKNNLIRYVVNKDFDPGLLPPIAQAQLMVNIRNTPDEVVRQIHSADLSREMIPTEMLNHPKVMLALAEKMPYTALMRNLGNLSAAGVFNNKSLALKTAQKLSNPEIIERARAHPINILTAYRTYTQGRGFRGSKTWIPDKGIVRALEQAFYASFKNVSSTHQRILVGLDVSGSMSIRYDNGVLSAAEIGAATLMTLMRTEPWVEAYGFCHTLTPLNVTAEDSLETVLTKTRLMNFGATDCALPIQYALRKHLMVDTFVVITDNETWYGRVKPSDALQEYREKVNPNAKLLVLATTATEFSIADPNDAGMLDIAGFDSAVPQIMREFMLGNI